jgi:hypothetical protein
MIGGVDFVASEGVWIVGSTTNGAWVNAEVGKGDWIA